jgi:hypothetical protein
VSMTDTTDPGLATSLPVDPFTALAVNFGMLLGVTDFDALAANPRGKMRLHNAWLHGQGVVWGYPVTLDGPSRELRVGPGLALDAVGHELALSVLSCVDVGAWYDTTSTDPASGLPPVVDGQVTFDAHVVVRFQACLAQPVPAMASPCAGSATDTAYSRVNETVELLLVPGPAPARDEPFPRLRALFGLPAAGQPDAEVQAALATLAGLPSAQLAQGWLDALHTLAADDVIDLAPLGLQPGHVGSSLLFAQDEPADVVLADLNGLTLTVGADGTRKASVASIDPSVRTSHVRTTTITDLLTAAVDGSGVAGGGAAADAGGPRLDPTCAWDGATAEITVVGTLLEGTLADGITAQSFDASAGTPQWAPLSFTASFDQPTQTLTVDTNAAAVLSKGDWVRIVAYGTGATPVMGPGASATDPPVPLAGPVGGPPGTVTLGHDVAFILQRSQP